MNFSLNDIPCFGSNPVVFMDILVNEEPIGRIFIKLYPEVFPAGVENFIRIACGKTYRVDHRGRGRHRYRQEWRRTYEGCRFFYCMHNNYIVSGDIYNNDGTNAGTIYCDQPIPPLFGEFYFPHEMIGLVSLIPYQDQQTGLLFYDSTFIITLDDAGPSNVLPQLDIDHVVIGQVYNGLDIILRINRMIMPFAGRRYPNIKIGLCGAFNGATPFVREIAYRGPRGPRSNMPPGPLGPPVLPVPTIPLVPIAPTAEITSINTTDNESEINDQSEQKIKCKNKCKTGCKTKCKTKMN